MIRRGVDIHVDIDYYFKFSTLSGNLDVVKFFVENNVNIHGAFLYAARER